MERTVTVDYCRTFLGVSSVRFAPRTAIRRCKEGRALLGRHCGRGMETMKMLQRGMSFACLSARVRSREQATRWAHVCSLPSSLGAAGARSSHRRDKSHADGCISSRICPYTLKRTENAIYATIHSRNVNGALTLYLAWPSVCWTAVEKLGQRRRRSRVTAS